ncbi:MAG: hypothetical protein WBO95_11500 [Candidatus Dechloromonas phosphoritropha]
MTIKRLNYFNGQFLRQEDFNDEQSYHLTMRRSHNRRTHTPGIVDGLTVLAAANQVTVSDGLAVDQFGREIILDAATPVPVAAGDVNAFVVIFLDEKKTDIKTETGIPGETRWSESPVLQLADSVPAGAVGLAQIAAVAGSGTVTLNGAYRRIYSAPALAGDLTVGRDLTVYGKVVLGDEDSDAVTVEGTISTGHSSGRLKIGSSVEVTGDIVVSGTVDGRDVSSDGSRLDTHAASTTNPHATSAAQVDTQGGSNRLATQINAGTGIIAEVRIDSAIARETRFNAANGHDHDGSDSKKISPTSLEGVNPNVTAANLNVLTGGSTSNAAALHTHPFVPGDGSVTLKKLDLTTRLRMLRVPLLAQSLLNVTGPVGFSSLSGIAFDGTWLWVADSQSGIVVKIDPATNVGVATVAVGYSPFALVFGGGYLWVTNWSNSTVSKIDVVTNTVVATISVGSAPNVLTISGGSLWVANYYGNSVSKIDMATNSVAATVTVGVNPTGLAVVGSFLWAANTGSNSVSKINMASNTVVAEVSVGSQPRGLATATATFLWVANSGNNTVSKVDVGANTVAATIAVANQPVGIAVIGTFVWVGESGQVQKVDTTTNAVVATVPGYVGPYGNGMVSVGGFLWVSGQVQVNKIDVTANTVAATVLPAETRGMAFDGLYLWVAVYGSSRIVKVDIDTLQIVQTVPVGTKPHSVAYNGSHIFVTNYGGNSVSKIDPLTGTVVATIAVGANPAGIAYNAYYRTLWVANSGDGTVSVISDSATSVAATYPVGTNPQGVACESYYVWVTNTGSNTVTRLGAWVGGSVVATISVAAAPQAIVFDNARMWVAHAATNNLSTIAIDNNTPATVALPAGAQPTRMCFNGTHILVQCTGGQAYRIDTYTNTVQAIPGSGRLGSGSASSVLAFDGVSTWAADNGVLYKIVV